jgi:hypothetical protein
MSKSYDLDEDEREYCRIEQMRFVLGNDDYYRADGKNEPEEDEEDEEDNMALPYTEDIAKEKRDGAVWPEELFKKA